MIGLRRLVVAFDLIEQIVGLFGELIAIAIVAILCFVVSFDDTVAGTLYRAGEVVCESFTLTTVREISCSSTCGCPDEDTEDEIAI